MRGTGPTGTFPRGRLNKKDRGALRLAIGVNREAGIVVVDFGTDLSWIGLAPSDVRGIVARLTECANEIEEMERRE